MQFNGLFVGLTTIDIQYFVNEYPERNKKVKTSAPDILVGGPASNAAVAFSYLNGGAHLATAVGKNSFTTFIENDFCNTNIKCFDFANAQKMNPVVASVVTSGNGDRNIFTNNPPDIQLELDLQKLFDTVKPQILLIDGFYPDISIECARLAKENGIPVVIDGGSWKPQYARLLKYVDIAICSADFLPPECSDSNGVFTYLKNMGVNKIAISRGEQSILSQQKDKKSEICVKTAKVIDTLGAGDFLHGAFCYYFIQNLNFEDALKNASKLATKTCAHKGTRTWLNF